MKKIIQLIILQLCFTIIHIEAKNIDSVKGKKFDLFSTTQEEVDKLPTFEQQGYNDYSGLNKGSGESKGFPEKYEEMLKEKGYSPFNIPNESQLEKMQTEYQIKKGLKWVLVAFGIIFLVYASKFLFKISK